MDTQNLRLLNKATISYDYLHTNSTTHEYLLGAIAELVDNSRDAEAKNLNIDFDEDKECLSILDDGCGMTHKEAVHVISFGFSNKRNIEGMIGQYGNGLKSGAMRIATDMILLTKKDGQLSCLLLSRTFHKEHDLKEVFVPSPCFNAEDRHMMCQTEVEINKHRLEMSLIYKYSPFTDQNQLFSQFEKIKGESGTLIILYNLRRLVTGDLELDFKSTTDDIRLTDAVAQREEEYNSLRAYLSILYLHPKMKIYLRGKKITATRLTSTLMMKYKYKYMAKNLKACAMKEHEACKIAVKDAEERLRVAQSDFGTFANGEHVISDKNDRVQRRLLSAAVEGAKEALAKCKEREVAAKKAINNPQPLSITFGVNIHHRNRYGCMFYNNGRLILAYQKGQAQKERNDLMMTCLGVVGIVDVPYSVLAPTHNKQSFENQREYLTLLRQMNEMMMKYWTEIGIGISPSAIKQFWKQFGYSNSDWTAEPAGDLEAAKNRWQRMDNWIQCNDCLLWRRVPFQLKFVTYGIPDNWCCADHPNAMNRKCTNPQEVEKIKEGTLKAEKQIEPAVVKNKTNGKSRTSVDSSRDNTPDRPVSKPSNSSASSSSRGPGKRVNKPPARYESEEEEEEEEEISDEEPVRKRSRNPPAPAPKKAVAPAAPPKKLPPPAAKSSDRSPRGIVAKMKNAKTVDSSSDDEMPPPRSARKREPAPVTPPVKSAPKTSTPNPTKRAAVIPKQSASMVDVVSTSSGRNSMNSRSASATSSNSTPSKLRKELPEVIVKESVSTDDDVIPTSSSRDYSQPSSSQSASLDYSERAELNRLRETTKASNYLIRDLLKQIAKKGCTEADKYLRLSDEKIRETIDCEKMINNFWEEKVMKPRREVETRSLNALDKRVDSRVVEKVIEKEKIVEVEVVPENLKALTHSSIVILKWLFNHYHTKMNLPVHFDINEESVVHVAEKMCKVLNCEAEGDEENIESS